MKVRIGFGFGVRTRLNDNGFGISWNFGIEPGTRTSAAKLIFSEETVDPCADPDAVSLANPDPEVVAPSFAG